MTRHSISEDMQSGWAKNYVMILPGNANLPIGAFRHANREIGVPGLRLGIRSACMRY
jgi:hypothetical protein